MAGLLGRVEDPGAIAGATCEVGHHEDLHHRNEALASVSIGVWFVPIRHLGSPQRLVSSRAASIVVAWKTFKKTIKHTSEEVEATAQSLKNLFH